MPRVFPVLACCMLPTIACAQPCTPSWSEEFSSGSFVPQVHDFEIFDEDGAGPAEPALFAAGSFNPGLGTEPAWVARWDGSQWTGTHATFDDVVMALAVHDTDGPGGPKNGKLYAAGLFSSAGGSPGNRIASWDGITWSKVGTGLRDTVYALAEFDEDGPGGDSPALFAGGAFSTADGSPADFVARWDGKTWSNVGLPFVDPGDDGHILALTVFDDGSGPALYAAGRFPTPMGSYGPRVFRWDAANWTDLTPDGELGGDSPYAMAEWDEDGPGEAPPRLYVGGDLHSPGKGVVCWTGEAWEPLIGEKHAASVNGRVYDLRVYDPDGDGEQLPGLLVSGDFSRSTDEENPSHTRLKVAMWNGTLWSDVGGGVTAGSSVETTELLDSRFGGGLLLGGSITQVGGAVRAVGAARWDGDSWWHTGASLNDRVRALAVADLDAEGPEVASLYAGGEFEQAGGVSAAGVCRRKGTVWEPLGTGVEGGTVLAMAPYHDAPGSISLYVAGTFTEAGGQAAGRIAKWDGLMWTSIPGLADGQINALLVADPDGVGPQSEALFAAGDFDLIGGVDAANIARWDGTSWSALGMGVDLEWGGADARALALFDDGTGPALYVGGWFDRAGGTSANCIARWDGHEWSTVGSAGLTGEGVISVKALMVHDDGTGPALYAGGNFLMADDLPVGRIARWDGDRWSALAGGIAVGEVKALASVDFDGMGAAGPALVAAGQFGQEPPAHIQVWDGGQWALLGGGVNHEIDALVAEGASLVAGGRFTAAGSVSSGYLARFGCPAPLCYPDFTGDGTLDLFDLLGYVNAFNAGDDTADCDGNGTLDLFDFLCFVNAFNEGC